MDSTILEDSAENYSKTNSEHTQRPGSPAGGIASSQMTASGSPDNELEITLDSPTREITVSGPPGSVGVPHLRKKMMSLCSCLRRSWFMKEVFMLLKLVLPLFLLNVFQQLPYTFSLLFVGKFSGSLELAATALGTTFSNVTGLSVIIGLATAADTLCPQSYGFKNYKRVGVILQRGLLIIFLACIPMCVLWLNSESILLLLGQIPCVIRLTGKFLGVYILALPGLVIFVMLQKYLQAQSLVWVFVGVGILMNVALVAFLAIFIVGAKLGVIGASLSMVLAGIVTPVLLILYIRCRNLHRQTWGGWSFESLTEWWQFIKLGVPGFLMLAFEWWSLEISTLVTGSIDEVQLAINSVLIQVASTTFAAPLGMAIAVNIRVGNELGAGNEVAAKRSSYVALGMQTVFAVALVALIFSMRYYIGWIFTSDEVVVDGVGDTMVASIGLIFFDQIQGVISGIMRASGRQAVAALVNFVSYYVVGLPLGIILALVAGLKTKGVWIGLSVGDSIQTFIFLILLFTTNWKKQRDKAMKNASGGSDLRQSGHTSLESLSSSTSSIDDEVGNSGIELRQIFRQENNPGNQQDDLGNHQDDHVEEVSGNHDDVLLVSYEDTEKLLSPSTGSSPLDPPTYTSSSKRFCVTKRSIIISRIVILLVGVVFLVTGGILAGSIRHHPSCDENFNISNCSLICQLNTIPHQAPSRTKGFLTPTPVIITPTESYDTSTFFLSPTPSPIPDVPLYDERTIPYDPSSIVSNQSGVGGSGMGEMCRCHM